jgi:glycosyltransferase involved in cell wall biosynthesis
MILRQFAGGFNKSGMILFVTGNSDTFSNPTLFGLCSFLESSGEKVILISTTQQSYLNPFNNVKLLLIQKPIREKSTVIFLKDYVKYIINFLLLVRSIFLKTPKIILGIDPFGIPLAARIKKYSDILLRSDIRLDYLNFEMLFGDEGATEIKTKEIEACKNIHALVIQDTLRENLIRTENKISDRVRSFYIPVAPLLEEYKVENQAYDMSVRDKFKICNSKLLVSFFGSFSNWSGADIIIEAIKRGLPDNVVLIIHSRSKLDTRQSFSREINDLSEKYPGKVIIDTDYLPSFNAAVAYLSQFDLGLVFYQAVEGIFTGKNIINIGLSSGKFSMFMSTGIPVLVSNLPTYAELLEEYHFGHIVNNADDIVNFLSGYLGKSSYTEECRRLYSKRLDPSSSIKEYVNSFI